GNAACATRTVSSGIGPIEVGCNDTAGSPLSEIEPTSATTRPEDGSASQSDLNSPPVSRLGAVRLEKNVVGQPATGTNTSTRNAISLTVGVPKVCPRRS